MQFTNSRTYRTFEVTHVRLQLPVRFDDEDMPYDFPLREGDTWSATVELATGKIKEWPKGKSGKVDLKVVDEGIYTLLLENGHEVARVENDYVPHGVVPGEYGDYVRLDIGRDGVIKNWPKQPNLSKFEGQEED